MAAAPEHLDVRAAGRRRFHLEQHLAGAGRRHRDLPHLDLFRAEQHRPLHGRGQGHAPPPAARDGVNSTFKAFCSTTRETPWAKSSSGMVWVTRGEGSSAPPRIMSKIRFCSPRAPE